MIYDTTSSDTGEGQLDATLVHISQLARASPLGVSILQWLQDSMDKGRELAQVGQHRTQHGLERYGIPGSFPPLHVGIRTCSTHIPGGCSNPKTMSYLWALLGQFFLLKHFHSV